MEIDYPSLSDRVYEYLCNQIIEGEIRYGERLNIKILSEHLKVSNMPVRDAIKKLEMENIVQIKPRSNCIVKVPTKKSILDAFDMRVLLEIHSLERAEGNVTEQDLGPLRDTVAEMGRIVQGKLKNKEIRSYIHLDQQFHTELCALSGNEYLKKFYREVVLHLNMTYIYRIGVPPDVQRTYKDHLEIVDLVMDKPRLARELLEKHLDRSRSNIVHGEMFRSLD